MARAVRWRWEPVNMVEAAALLAAAGLLGARLGAALLGGPGGAGGVPAPAAAWAGVPPTGGAFPWLGIAVYAFFRRWVPVEGEERPGRPAPAGGTGRGPGRAPAGGTGREQGTALSDPGRGRGTAAGGTGQGRSRGASVGLAPVLARAGVVACAVVLALALVLTGGGALALLAAHVVGGEATGPAGPGGPVLLLAWGLMALGLLAAPGPFPWPVAAAAALMLFQAYRRDGRLRRGAALLLAATALCFLAALAGASPAGVRPHDGREGPGHGTALAGPADRHPGPRPAAAAAVGTAYGLALGLFNAAYTGRSRLVPKGMAPGGGPAREPQARPVPVVISGFYGAGNTGDEAILASLLGLLRQRGYWDITVFSIRPEETARRHAVASVYRGWRRHWLAKARALLRAGIFISGGGGLLQDTTPTFLLKGPVPYYLLIATWARLAGCWVLFLGQGIGPLRGRWARWLTRQLGGQADVITVRDAESLALLEEVGVTRPPRRLLADFVFAAPAPDPRRAERVARAEGLLPGARRLVVSVRSWPGEDRFYPELAAFLREVLASRPDVEVVLVPMEGELDRAASQKLASLVAAGIGAGQAPPVPDGPARARTGDRAGGSTGAGAPGAPAAAPAEVPPAPGEHGGQPAQRPVDADPDPLRRLHVIGAGYEPADIEALVGSAYVAVGMRLHFLLFAARAGVPVLALNYDPKVAGAMRRLGASRYVFELDRVRAGDLLAAFAEVEGRYDEISRDLRQAAAGLAPLATAHLDYVDAAARRIAGQT